MNALLSANLVLLTGEEGFNYLFDLTAQLLQDAALMIIAVVTLFFIASHFLFNPAREMLRKRQAKIKNELEDAKESMESADACKAEYEDKLKNVGKEAEDILTQARKKALENENRIIAEAKQEAASIIKQAKNEAELEKRKAADDVKKEMIAIAALMAGKVTEGAVDVSIQDSLVEETLKEIGEKTWLS